MQRRKPTKLQLLFVANNCETFLISGSKHQKISNRTVNKSHQISIYNHRTNSGEDTR